MEQLEDRTLLAGSILATATALTLPVSNVVRVSDFIDTTTNVDMFSVALNAGDRVTVDLNAQSIGSGLNSYVRVFFDPDVLGVGQPAQQIAANDDFDGRDSRLTFQAGPAGGTYFIGASSSGNENYDPATGTGATPGTTRGQFELVVTRTAASGQPDLVGSVFEVAQDFAAAGNPLTISYRIENRGGAATGAGNFTVEFFLSSNSIFEGNPPGPDISLGTVSLGPLAAGANSDLVPGTLRTFNVAALPAFATGPAFIGMRIDTTGAVAESNESNNCSQRRGSDWDSLAVLTAIPENEGVNNDTVNPQDLLNGQATGTVGAGDTDYFKVTVPVGQTGRLTATAHALIAGYHTRLSLLRSDGTLLIESDGQSASNLDSLIAQHLVAGDYYLKIEGLSAGSSGYTLSAVFEAAISPLQPTPVLNPSTSDFQSMLSYDVNNDGVLDLIYPNFGNTRVEVLLGLGDGTFQASITSATGATTFPHALAAGDLTGDGIPDLVVAEGPSGGAHLKGLTVMQGLGNGQFVNLSFQPLITDPVAVAITDLDNDGFLDVVATGGQTYILFGDGTGALGGLITKSGAPNVSLVVRDFTADGQLDVAVSSNSGDSVTLFVNTGSRTFSTTTGPFSVGDSPGEKGLISGDFNSDGNLDLVASSGNLTPTSGMALLLGNGNGLFQTKVMIPLPSRPFFVFSGDFNTDGKLDLLVGTDIASMYVLLGLGNGSFQPLREISIGTPNGSTEVADFNDDGQVDFATDGSAGTQFPIFLGNGDGTFQATPFLPSGTVSADLNNDGVLDLVGPADLSNAFKGFSVSLGRGDGTFENGRTFALPGFVDSTRGPAIVAEDFNGDGRKDLGIISLFNGELYVLLGLGDGTFQPPTVYVAPGSGNGIVAGRLNNDSVLDLVLVGAGQNASVLIGNPDGTFQSAVPYSLGAAGRTAKSVGLADFDRNGTVDIVAARFNDTTSVGELSLLSGFGNGTFSNTPITIPMLIGTLPQQLLIADFDHKNGLDIAVANNGGPTPPFGNASRVVSVFLNSGANTLTAASFPTEQPYLAGATAHLSLAVGDFDGDTFADLAVGDGNNNAISVLLNDQLGGFGSPTPYLVGANANINSLFTADLNRDGRLDLYAQGQVSGVGTGTGQLLLGVGNGSFVPPTAAGAATQRPPAQFGDFNNDQRPDIAVLDEDGHILIRLQQDNGFGAPVTVNPALGDEARDLVLLTTGPNTPPLLAALESKTGQFVFYARQANGTFTTTNGPVLPGALPVGVVASGDLNGGGDDLVVAIANTNQLLVYFNQGNNSFSAAPNLTFNVGLAPSDVELVDLDGQNGLDILVSNRFSGDVSALFNSGSAPFFAAERRFRSGTGRYAAQVFGTTVGVQSLEFPEAVVAALLNGDGTADLVVADSGSSRVALLAGTGLQGFANPNGAANLPTGIHPTALAVADFNRSDPRFDLAVLSAGDGMLTVYTNNPAGTFTSSFAFAVGASPTGLRTTQLNDDNQDHVINGLDNTDLIVSNVFGDVLVLYGNGDATFRPVERVGQSIPLGAVNVGGQERIVLASEELDRVKVLPAGQLDGTAAPASKSQADGVKGPDAIRLEDINGDTRKDLIVANGGSNNVLVYLGQVGGGFGPEVNGGKGVVVGTNPVAVTTRDASGNLLDFNGDTFADIVVVNKGSNDVSILLGNGAGGFTSGPRLDSGGIGPVSVIVDELTGDARLDLQVTNGQSLTNALVGNNVLLPGVGTGFFNDVNPTTTTLGGNPVISIPIGTRRSAVIEGTNGVQIVTTTPGGPSVIQDIDTRGTNPINAVSGVDGAGNDFLLVGSSDGILELFLDSGGELVSQGFLDTDLNISAMALSVIQGSRVFYVTSDGKEQAFAFSLDDFAKPSDETVADLPSDSVAIIAALVAGSSDVSAADYFGGADGETVNFGELLFFSDNGGAPTGAGGGDSASEVLEQLRQVAQRFVQGWAVTLGTGEGSGWQVIVSAVRSVLDTVGAVEVAGFNPFAGWQTVVVHLQLPSIGEALVHSIANAGQATLGAGPVAAGVPGEAALRDFVFGSSLAAPFDGFESLAATDEGMVKSPDDESLLPEEAVSRWWALPVERQAEELLLAGLLAATLWQPEPARERRPGRDTSSWLD